MDMITDSVFRIGSTHEVCEDYALSGSFRNIKQEDISYAIISDGCSASNNVDIGARLLTHATEMAIKGFFKSDDFYNNSSGMYINQAVGGDILRRSKCCIDLIGGLENYALDATVIFAVSDGSSTFIHAYGDGNIVLKTVDKTTIYNIEFETGAPYYLSYDLEDDRRYTYKMATENAEMKKLIKKIVINKNGDIEETIETVDFDHQFYLDIKEPLISVSVMSDGVETYRQFNEDAGLLRHDDLKDSVESLTSFKNYGKEFAKRRLSAFHRKGKENQLEHTDDVSVGTIVFKHNLGI